MSIEFSYSFSAKPKSGLKGQTEVISIDGGMNNTKPVRCQKCGKPLGYVTVLAKGLTSFQQPIQNVKIVAICMECYQKNR